MSRLELQGIVQRYGNHTVVDGVGFRPERGATQRLESRVSFRTDPVPG